jgi:hypothetical protein
MEFHLSATIVIKLSLRALLCHITIPRSYDRFTLAHSLHSQNIK